DTPLFRCQRPCACWHITAVLDLELPDPTTYRRGTDIKGLTSLAHGHTGIQHLAGNLVLEFEGKVTSAHGIPLLSGHDDLTRCPGPLDHYTNCRAIPPVRLFKSYARRSRGTSPSPWMRMSGQVAEHHRQRFIQQRPQLPRQLPSPPTPPDPSAHP